MFDPPSMTIIFLDPPFSVFSQLFYSIRPFPQAPPPPPCELKMITSLYPETTGVYTILSEPAVYYMRYYHATQSFLALNPVIT